MPSTIRHVNGIRDPRPEPRVQKSGLEDRVKSEPSDIHDPKTRRHLAVISTSRKCSRSMANLRDVIHGSKRQIERPPSCSPHSIGRRRRPAGFQPYPGHTHALLQQPILQGLLQHHQRWRGTPPRKSPSVLGLFDREGHVDNYTPAFVARGLGGRRNGNRRVSVEGDCHGTVTELVEGD
ncbi:hypothetical protein SAY87_030236 [Trapa incisa]|uniref:Uncharacterized protein n=1 Tax=Trapa incisa TaxID=236973 RepID=A0AAN7KN01_9MYRT|nr:hypothetical protein SAY87_030236 [Trapa incisa]